MISPFPSSNWRVLAIMERRTLGPCTLPIRHCSVPSSCVSMLAALPPSQLTLPLSPLEIVSPCQSLRRQRDADGGMDGSMMPELGAWISHGTTFEYWIENLSTVGGHPSQVSDLPGLLACVWGNSTRESWSNFLGVALLGAATEGNLEGVKQLTSAGAKLRSKNRNGLTPLHLASVAGHVGVVRRLLGNGDDLISGPAPIEQPRLVWQQSCDGPLLMSAASVQKLKSTVELRDNLGSCPLHLAAARGNADVVDLLLGHGANPCVTNGLNQTPLHTAATCLDQGGSDAIALLIHAGADVTARDNAGRTPLHVAAYGGVQAAMPILVRDGADIEARGSINSCTPLHEACARVHPESVKRLLDLGADERAVDINHRSPRDIVGAWLAEYKDPAMARLVHDHLERAPKERTWRRRRWLLLLRRRQPPLRQQTEPGVTQMAEDGVDLEPLAAILVGLDDGIFRSVVSYL